MRRRPWAAAQGRGSHAALRARLSRLGVPMLAGLLCAVSALGAVAPQAVAAAPAVAVTRAASGSDGVQTAPASTALAPSAVAPRASGEVPRLVEAEALRIGQAAVGREVPDDVLLDRRGRRVRLTDYRGKPLLVSFIYTGCFQICPTQTKALLDAVKGLETLLGADQFNVVSIGFNQPFDDPQAMRAFAAQQRIQAPNWEFLSPPPAAVESLTRAFGFSYVATPAGFDHLLGVTVVDARGRIHAQVYGERLRSDQIGRPLRELLLAEPPGVQSTLAAMVERVRILCTKYDTDSGEYRYDYKLILELIGGLLFFGTMTVYFLLEWRNRLRSRKLSCTITPASGSAA
ncbi:MAG: SCO family protein [Proteobacteria bacterium]|nr:SCO family protein [Pseudomonadota bacterium]